MRVIKNGNISPVPNGSVEVDSSVERGLLGIAFDRDFSMNQYAYLYYTAVSPSFTTASLALPRHTAVPGSEAVIIEIPDLGPRKGPGVSSSMTREKRHGRSQ